MSALVPTEVIREVKIRPGIYNRDALVAPRREHRQQLWMEVAESLTPQKDWESFTEAQKELRIGEVSNKWKNLRDHFYREIKLIESGGSNKKRKYIYFDEMEFVRPYIGYKLPPQNKRPTKSESKYSTYDSGANDSDIDMDAFLKLSDSETKFSFKKEPGRQKVSGSNSAKKYNSKTKLDNSGLSNDGNSSKEAVINNFDMLQKKPGAKNPTFKIRESDISFCLSLVPTLRELDGARKLRAKIDMLKVLHKNLDEVERKEKTPKRRRIEYEEMSEDTEDEMYDKVDPLHSSDKHKKWRRY